MGKQALILYASRTGFTRRYAEWLGQALDASCIALNQFSPEMADETDLLLCGGGIYGDELNGVKKYKRLRKQFPNKEFLFFATGLRPVSEQTAKRIINYNFGSGTQTKLFYCSGGLDLEHLEPAQKSLLTVFRAMLRRKRDSTEQDAALLQRLTNSGDFCDPEQLGPLLDYLKGAIPIQKPVK